MKRILYFLILITSICLFLESAQAQKLNWDHNGPESLGSRTRSIIFDANGNLLAGSSEGGLWKSENKGRGWQKVLSYDEAGGSSVITSMVRNGNNIYVATGETEFLPVNISGHFGFEETLADGAVNYGGLPGKGIYVSTDNGASWSNSNGVTQAFQTLSYEGPFVGIQKLALSPSGRILIASREGLYFSDDKDLGTVNKANGPTSFTDRAIFDIDIAGSKIFATTVDSLYVSNDGGDNFKSVFITDQLVGTERVEVAVSPTNDKVMYLAGVGGKFELRGIYRSDDQGDTWRTYSPSSGPGFTPLLGSGKSALALAVVPGDDDAIIIAGRSWYIFDKTVGWTQNGVQNFSPSRNTYVPPSVYTIVYDPNDSKTMYIGTATAITRSTDGGSTFSRKAAGYAAATTYFVNSTKFQDREVVLASSPKGTMLNANFANPSSQSAKGFGTINTNAGGRIHTSYLYPGVVLAQGSSGDRGPQRASIGSGFERIYGLPLNTDTVLSASGVRDSVIFSRLNGITGAFYIDRSSASSAGGALADNGKLSPITQFVVDEFIPPNMIAPASAKTLQELKAFPGKDALQALPHYAYFASSEFVWLGNYALGNSDGLTPRWDKITNKLMPNGNVSEYFTAMTVAPNGSDVVYVGTSKGRLWRISGATDFEFYDGTTNNLNVIDLGTTIGGNFDFMAGRWISDISINPQKTSQIMVTFAGHGGDDPIAYSWLIDGANGLTPSAEAFSGSPYEQAYTCSFYEYEDGGSKKVGLLLGTENNLYSTKDISATTSWQKEFPDSYGRNAVYDIFVRKYENVTIDEETNDFVLREDNTIFVATNGYGIWSTTDVKFKGNREGTDPKPELTFERSVELTPNPIEGGVARLTVTLDEDATVDAALYTLDGRMLNTIQQSLKKGKHQVELNTQTLNSGIYMTKVKIKGATGQLVKTIKTVIQN